MCDKKELLSIGEIAKLTGVGIQALRYYERKNILRPVFVDPDSGYRYYSLDQLYDVSLIMNCVQLDIPLKEMAEVFHADDMLRVEDFLTKCRRVAERKVKMLNAGIDGFGKVLKKIEHRKQHRLGQIYSMDFTEKHYQIKSCEQPLKGADLIKTLMELVRGLYGESFSRIAEEDNIDELLSQPDIGCLYKPETRGRNYYCFTEIPISAANEHSIMIPAGTYFFVQNENSLLENAREVFKEHIEDIDDYMVIETQEPFFSKSKISKPMYELRLIAL